VADLNAALFVNCYVEKVEQIAADINPAACPNATPLHRRIWSSVNGRPSRTAVECLRDIKMPYTSKTIRAVCRLVASCCRSVKGDGGATRIARNRGGVCDVS